MIVQLKKEHAEQVARLHISGIPTGFISSLGEKFVTSLYESIADNPYSFGLVEEKDSKVVGFIAFTTNLKGLFKSVCLKKSLYFFFILFTKFFSIKTVKKIYETLFYPSRSETKDLPQAELLSIAVLKSERGRGLAKILIRCGLHKCHEMGIDRVKVLVADFNQPANNLYRAVQFKHITQIENHGIVSNVYIVSTDHFVENK